MTTSVLSPEPCILAEGPHWDSHTQTLYYVDIIGQTINKFKPSTDEFSKVNLDGMAGFIVPRKQNANQCVIGVNRNLQMFDWTTKKITQLAEIDTDKTNTRLNDGKCSPEGRLWAGTMAIENPPGYIAPEQGTLYCFEADKSPRKTVSPVSISNGLAWSSDTKTFYYIDSTLRRLDVFDYDAQQGTISNRRVGADFTKPQYAPLSSKALPDGMTIDTEGKLWVAFFNGKIVMHLDPETGTPLRRVDIPASKVTSCCFGGPMMEDLYVTTAKFGLSDEEFKAEPLAGNVFCIKGLGARGLPMTPYSG